MSYFKRKNILLISPEPWGQNFVSKHHYATTLAKQQNTVYFLNPPTSTYKIRSTQYDDLYVIDYAPFLKGLRYLPSKLQSKIIRRKYKKIEQLAKCSFNIIWSFDNSVFYDFSGLPEHLLKISHIVDLNQNFQTAKAAYTANICFCTTDLIRRRLLTYNKNTFKIHHGYSPSIKIGEPAMCLPGINSVKAVYVGNLAFPYIDWLLLRQVAENHIDVDFIFIGPDGESNLSSMKFSTPNREMVRALKNTYFTGSVPYHYIPSLLSQADVLIVAYREEHHHDQASPHKMMEYLASGKTIVATCTSEYKDKKDILIMAEKNEEYPALFAKVIANLNDYNEQGKQKKRKNFALNNTYQKQIEKIESRINILNPNVPT